MQDHNNLPDPLDPGSEDDRDPQLPAETDTDNGAVADADEAVHNQPEVPTEENKQQDGDDAVHKNYKPAPDSAHENEERDPDDLAHGNL